MRKLIVTVLSTLDGYAAGEGGNVFVMPIDLGFDRYNLERMQAAETMVFGATSFHGARGYWPPLADDESAPAVEREISRLHNTLDKIVVSDSTAPADTEPWSGTTEVVGRAHAADRLTELRSGDGGDIVCFGSLTAWNDLLAQGLVDELHVMVGPGAIGAGLPTFNQPVSQRLSLLDARRLDDSELVALQYAVGPTIS
ncbi:MULTISPECIES: dihydrofolate reductase family protein [Nocardioides]|jgi:dihydrofolate reductase|uniref:dihydrofolate reductase family protein n=1 Tax=Nocardioides TaxID=1839 RepID=UPI0003306400|nr:MULTISPECIES: dihydrofolate reductase family protein [Nocardioides]EON24575.1 bifunctional deaminase-reductase domain protein [Nocardioides sp. CF8]